MARMGRALLLACVIAACGGHGAGTTCHDLALGECRSTPGCKPDLCDGCICDVTFRGCLAASETPTACPQLGCPGGECCNTQAQCATNTTCAPPGTPPGCGVCNTEMGDCTSDAQCKPRGATLVCDPIACTCTDQRRCVQGCTSDAACGDGTHCDTASARCVPLACTQDPDCPGNFHCSASHTCERSTCTTDNDCDGFCVLGQCFGSGRGECRPPSA